MKKLYQFHWDCGRMGDLEGMFVADDADVKAAIGKRVYFGEVLGKHSEIFGDLEEKDLTVVTDDPDVIKAMESALGQANISGYNPLDCIEEEED